MTRLSQPRPIILRIISAPPGEIPPSPLRLADGRATIGRRDGNSWVLPDVSAGVSREHAVIERSHDGWRILDKSANGTFVNGQKVGNGNAWPLNANDSIRIGGYEIAVELEDIAGPSAELPVTGNDSFDRGDLARPDSNPPCAPSPLDPFAEKRPPSLSASNDPFSEFRDDRLRPETSPFDASAPQRSAVPKSPDPLAVPGPFDQQPLAPDEWHAPIPQSPFIPAAPASPKPTSPRAQEALPADWDTPTPRDFSAPSPERDSIEAALPGLTPKTDSSRTVVPNPGIDPAFGIPPQPAPQPASSDADGAGDTVVSVFAPDRVAVGDDALVQVFLHLQEQAQSAFALAKEFDDRATRRGARALVASIAAGTLVQVTLSLPGLVVDPAIDTILWNRQPEAAQFSVRIPATHGLGTLVGTVRVMVDGAPLGALRFKLDVIAGAHSAATLPARIDARRYRRAFVSYASADRAEVLRRVQALRRVGIEVFQDVLDLEPGDRWERELYRHIDECDVVLLFWSSAARASEWVGREIDYAMARQARERSDDDAHDMPAIEPLPIEGPPIPEPPERLRHLHFNDALLYAIAGEDRLRPP